jgi:pyridoxamine 5'-phosphate oxidase family protein
MSNFTEKELEYLKNQRLGRLATVNSKGQPQIAPVGFRYNAELDTIEIGGRMMSQTQKWRNILKNQMVSFVVDDVPPPWSPRGVEVRGIAQAITAGGEELYGKGSKMGPAFIRIIPTQIIGWGIDGEGYTPLNRKIAPK